MRSAAAAMAWEFRRHHRWGVLALTVYFALLAAIRVVFLQGDQRVRFETAQTFAITVIVPLATMFMYFLAVFSFGLSGDIGARHSTYPPRMFTLPVTNSALAGWPMLFGGVAMAALWFATRFIGVWPADADVPRIWPALLAALLLAWTQALTWMAYPLRGLRVIVTVLWLASIDATVMVALQLKPSESVMLVLLAPHLPLAFLIARFAVTRARRGDVPDWSGTFAWLNSSRSTELRAFTSPARAQVWLEWRLHGRSLPALVAILLPFELSLLFVFPDTPAIVFETLAGVLLTPPFMAAFVAATVGRSGTDPFAATRPLTNATLIAAKLRATIVSALAAWLLVIVAIPGAVSLSGTAPIVLGWAQTTLQIFGAPRAVAIALLGLGLLVVTTWKQLVQSLFITMSGREWLAKASLFTALAVITAMPPVARWAFTTPRVRIAVWDAFPWVVAVLVCLKLTAAAAIAIRLYDRRVIPESRLLTVAACWSTTVLALYALLAWIFPDMLIRHYFLALVAILAVPLARPAAAPLALEANRHR